MVFYLYNGLIVRGNHCTIVGIPDCRYTVLPYMPVLFLDRMYDLDESSVDVSICGAALIR